MGFLKNIPPKKNKKEGITTEPNGTPVEGEKGEENHKLILPRLVVSAAMLSGVAQSTVAQTNTLNVDIDQISDLINQIQSFIPANIIKEFDDLPHVDEKGTVFLSYKNHELDTDAITQFAENAFDTCYKQLRTYYAKHNSIIAGFEDGKDFLRELFCEIVNTILDPKKLAPILADTAIISPGLYLCWEMVKKLQEFSDKGKNKQLRLLTKKCKKILEYFEKVPRSRVAEISAATKISTDEVKLLLQLMCFIRKPGGFWQPPITQKKKYSR